MKIFSGHQTETETEFHDNYEDTDELRYSLNMAWPFVEVQEYLRWVSGHCCVVDDG